MPADPLVDPHSLHADALWPLLAQQPADTALLCATQRLARTLKQDFAVWQHAHGRHAWIAPTVLSLAGWVQRQYADVALRLAGEPDAPPPLLAPAAVQTLWRTVVATDAQRPELLAANTAAALAAEAWSRLHDYALPWPLPAADDDADVSAFSRWGRTFIARCRRLNVLDTARVTARLAAEIANGRCRLPAAVVLAGLDAPTPSQGRLLEALAGAGVRLQRLQPPAHAPRVTRVAASDGEHELQLAADWVRARLEARPGARIGVVVPDLAARRDALLRVFDATMCPPATAPQQRPYTVSLGEPLAATPLVSTALRLLKLWLQPLDYAEAGALLRAPYWGDAEDELVTRARLDARLRGDGHRHVSLRLLARGNAIPAARRPPPAPRDARPPGQWSDTFSVVLRTAGWPGPRTLDSAEFQAHDAWLELLADFGGLDAVSGSLRAGEALAQLQRLAQDAVFQPQSAPVQVQVMGALETPGLGFDALRILGMDDENWPPPPRPHPLLPRSLQRRAGLPRSSAERELAFAERLTSAWQSAAPEVVFSHAGRDGDRELLPSPLIRGLPLESAPARAAAAPAWLALRAAAALETVTDDRIPPAASPSGGVALLSDQAACPFKAAARHRLKAESLDEPGFGPTVMDRGTVTHAALERVWSALGNSQALLDCDEDALRARVEEAADAALQALAQEAPQRLPESMRALEQARLSALLLEWLALERARPPFTVEHTEHRQARELHGLTLRVRVDRVDRVAGGRRLVIDYKTGRGDGPPWGEERPDEAQLLVYAQCYEDVAGVAYARLRTGQCTFHGVAAEDGLTEGIRGWERDRRLQEHTGWADVLKTWDSRLQALAVELLQGVAGVQPKHPKVCQRCGLHALCRVLEQRHGLDDDAEGAP